MEENFDTFHGSILLKANNRVNRPSKPAGDFSDRSLGTLAHAVGDQGVMGVKDYVHFYLPR
jgi:hypothetical protein